MECKEQIMVSINCITYNQEKYISKTIEGFLMQDTKFPFEILIHDDASTDNTPNIVKMYEKQYPDKIRCIFQTENQYSKGVHVHVLNGQRARGKYMAFCEGDDYWTDPLKLQKQIDFMENNIQYSLCTHSAITVDVEGNKLDKIIRPNEGDRDFTIEEVILGDGGLFPSNSMLFKTQLFKELPAFCDNCPVGDYPLVIFLALKGKVHYIDCEMSAYRVDTYGSWSQKMKKDMSYFIVQKKGIIRMLEEVDLYTKQQFHDTIYKRVLMYQIDKARRLAFCLPFKERIKYLFDCKELKKADRLKYCTRLFFAKCYAKYQVKVNKKH